MKKLQNISSHIKNNTFSYTGKGAFEAGVNNFKLEVISWLENLIPLQQQIQYLDDKTNLEYQKRNYTRILTKLLPVEYNEFVSLNILVRDSHIVAQYYKDEFNLTLLYEHLIERKYLKYPGKYEKYVEFELFQKFIMMYREELTHSIASDDVDTKEITKKTTHSEEIIVSKENKQPKQEKPKSKAKKETNWTNLLLGR